MSILGKKLYLKTASGAVYGCSLYTTTAEAGINYISLLVDGTQCYAALSVLTDPNASPGRVLKNGIVYSILLQIKPSYTTQTWTSPGTYTFTVPRGVSRIKVAVIGGGGGAAICTGAGGQSATGTDGGTSSVGGITATGGAGGYVYNPDSSGDREVENSSQGDNAG